MWSEHQLFISGRTMAWKWRWVIRKILRSFMAMSVLGIGAEATEDMVSSEESWVLQRTGVERDIPGRGAYSSTKEPLPSPSLHGIFQARVLKWVAISFSRGSSRPRIELGFPTLQADSLLAELQWNKS